MIDSSAACSAPTRCGRRSSTTSAPSVPRCSSATSASSETAGSVRGILTSIETIPFERARDRGVHEPRGDRLVRRRASDPAARPFKDRDAVLRRYAADGWRVLGLGWQPEIAEERRSRARTGRCRLRMHAGRSASRSDVLYCPHGAGPPVCWCRKPLPRSRASCSSSAIPARRVAVHLRRQRGPQDPGFARAVSGSSAVATRPTSSARSAALPNWLRRPQRLTLHH
mgnify:CR=1 FL=1